jgi:hypothetical protein
MYGTPIKYWNVDCDTALKLTENTELKTIDYWIEFNRERKKNRRKEMQNNQFPILNQEFEIEVTTIWSLANKWMTMWSDVLWSDLKDEKINLWRRPSSSSFGVSNCALETQKFCEMNFELKWNEVKWKSQFEGYKLKIGKWGDRKSEIEMKGNKMKWNEIWIVERNGRIWEIDKLRMRVREWFWKDKEDGSVQVRV